MNKSELQSENALLRENISLREVLQRNCRNYIFYCAECGNPFVLNEAQFEGRCGKNKRFFCSAGHANVFTSKND